ncbi:MAG: RnfABCDGE type electron transport complex subunit C [Candidatus Omnitrophica bacterium]|nr:RnfABCDGE type electron transport complex subunit C [Candidatus Omnitrophota bacterium]
MKPLRKGVRLPDFKYRSLSGTQIHLPRPARFLTFFLKQSAVAPAIPCVHEGEAVFVGSKIAEASEWNSVPLHSSVSGKVTNIMEDRIVIESDEVDKLDPSIQARVEIPSEPDQLATLIHEAGVVDLGGKGHAIHVHLTEARAKKVETLILDGCESEPFLTADHVLMLNHPVEILKGAEILRIASGAERVVIAVEQNKLEALELLNSKNYNLKFERIKTAVLPVRYPQGSERALAESILGRPLKKGETALEAGILVESVASAFAVYEAVYLKKPLYERVMTVSGSSILEPKNLWARMGTQAADLIRACKGFMREPERVIFGGPMTGRSIAHLDEPVTKEVPGILAFSSELEMFGKEETCIRCGFCIDICPVSLVPEAIVKAIRQGQPDLAQTYEIDSCTECGLCAYICPSYIPMVDIIRKGKEVFKSEDSEREPVYAFSSRD